MADRFGFEPGGEFAPAFEAAQRRLRGAGARRRAELARATSGVRTSGVRFIPQETLERGEQEAQAGLTGEFALRQAGENIQDRRLQEAFQRRLQLSRMGMEHERDVSRTAGRRAFQRRLVGGGIGAGLGIIGGLAGG